MAERRTRLAPSPTGALHLGNARTFLVNWAMARQRGWRIVLRIEDLDGPRIKPGADAEAIDTLQWLGMDWDEGPHYQLRDLSRYEVALAHLRNRELSYPCVCTRSEVASALSAPHADGEPRYPGTCRDRKIATGGERPTAIRVKVPNLNIEFEDTFAGRQVVNVQKSVGDFVIATKAGLPAYQLAVVVDDVAQGVTDIVRGDDLLDSAARQLVLYGLLKLGPIPRYTHLPLVVGPDGRRLAKRHGDTRLETYRRSGVGAERIVGLIAAWCGLGRRCEMDADTFAERFDLDAVPRDPIVMMQEDEAWLHP